VSPAQLLVILLNAGEAENALCFVVDFARILYRVFWGHTGPSTASPPLEPRHGIVQPWLTAGTVTVYRRAIRAQT
jgi:hypothetical protein